MTCGLAPASLGRMHTPTLRPHVTAPRDGAPLNVLGHMVTVKLDRAQTDGHYYVFEVLTPPGHGIPPHVHEREDEMIRVLEGEFAVRLGERSFQAPAGADIFFPRGVVHAFQNVGSGPGRTLWTVVPGGNFQQFFEQLDALPPGPPDPAKVAAIFAEFGMTIVG